MVTPLGGSTAVTQTVENTSANYIPEGAVVYANPAATLDRVGEEFILPVQNFAAGAKAVGIAVSAIQAGHRGLVMIVGVCLARTDGSVVYGNDLEAASDGGSPANGRLSQSSVTGSKVGFALHTDVPEFVEKDFDDGVAVTKALVLVNFTGASSALWS